MAMVLDQSVISVGKGALHMQDCSHDPCLSPSLGWLSPTRISFSRELSAQEADGAAIETTRAMHADSRVAHDGIQFKGKVDSMSEFEFAMAALEVDHDDATNGNRQILAADELFFKGKLLPLYVPQFIDQVSDYQYLSGHESGGLDPGKQTSSSPSTSSSLSSASYNAVNDVTIAKLDSKMKELMMFPPSPKTPRCSTKLKELFGLKKSRTLKGPYYEEIAASEMTRSSSKQRSLARECHKSPLHKLSKAKRLFCRSDGGMIKLPEAASRTSTSELLLPVCADTGFAPVMSFLPQHQANHIPLYCKKSHIQHVADCSLCCGTACSQIARMQRSGRVSDHGEEYLKVPSMQPPTSHQQLRVLKDVNNKENFVNARSSASYRKGPVKEDPKTALLRRPLNGVCVGSGESSPARRSSGLMSPTGSSGHWSPSRNSAAALLSGYNTACSSCRGSPGRHSISGASNLCFSPGRLSLGGAEQPMLMSSHEVGHGRLMRARSLERSSSYSPKSLQRKYDQMKAMRQREGWRPGLERSSSYNNMNSVRVAVAPVLNVPPRVCGMSRSSKTNACGLIHHHSSNGSSSFGLGHLFSTKNAKKASAPTKLQQSKCLSSSCRKWEHHH